MQVNLGADDNTRSYIRQGVRGAIKATSNEMDILSCITARFFWIGIDGSGALAVGKDSIPFKKQLMSWKDGENPGRITAVGIATDGGQAGVWEFTQVQGGST